MFGILGVLVCMLDNILGEHSGKKRLAFQRIKIRAAMTHLSSVISFTNLVYLPPTVVVLLTRDNSIHTTRFSPEHRCDVRFSPGSFDLQLNLTKTPRVSNNSMPYGLDLEAKCMTLVPRAGHMVFLRTVATFDYSTTPLLTDTTLLQQD